MPSPRERVLVFLKGLIDLHLETLHICITSRPEVDITITLNPLSFRTISLHNETGQKQDILNYLNSIVHTDVKMNRWRTEDKELVIDVLTRKADGM
jgi:alpha-D-ribose 1-methylphosphonate 5-triphosphate diphosphatase PhnM